MLVSQVENMDTHAVIGGSDVQSFGISNNAEFYTLLSDSLYSDKIMAVVREIMCNAWDAHLVAGKKDTVIETVEITQNQGGGLKITPMDGKKPKVKAKSKKTKAIDIDNRKGDKSKVSPKALRKKADNIIQSSSKTIAEQARELFEAGKYQALQEFKKIKKKSFKGLGFDASEIDKIN